MPVAIHIIQVPDLAALDALEVHGSLARPVRGEIVLSLADLDAHEQTDWQRRLNRKVFACGCGMAAGFGLGGMISFIVWRLAVPADLSSLTWGDIPLALLVFIAGVGIGKVLGLAIAGLMLRRSKLCLRALVLSRMAKEV